MAGEGDTQASDSKSKLFRHRDSLKVPRSLPLVPLEGIDDGDSDSSDDDDIDPDDDGFEDDSEEFFSGECNLNDEPKPKPKLKLPPIGIAAPPRGIPRARSAESASGSVGPSSSLPRSPHGLRSHITRQSSITHLMDGQQPPLSPPPKRRNSIRNTSISPYNSPGAVRQRGLRAHNSPGALGGGSLHRAFQRRRSNSPGPLGGSLHGGIGSSRPARSRSPGTLGGSLHTATSQRSRSPGALGGSLHGKNSSGGGLGGSLHGVSTRARQTPRSGSPGPLSPGVLSANNRAGRGRTRAGSPGPLGLGGGSLHGNRPSRMAPLSSSPDLRPGSPGALMGQGRSFRLRRGPSKRFTGPVSILRKGKFSKPANECNKDNEEQPAPSPCQSPGALDPTTRRLRRMSLSRKRVTFYMPDEESVALSYATEESMAFGDLGFDSGDEDVDYERSMCFGTPFDPMDMEFEEDGFMGLNDREDFGEYGEEALNDLGRSYNNMESFYKACKDGFDGSLGSSLNSAFSDDDPQLSRIQETDKESCSPHSQQKDTPELDLCFEDDIPLPGDDDTDNNDAETPRQGNSRKQAAPEPYSSPTGKETITEEDSEASSESPTSVINFGNDDNPEQSDETTSALRKLVAPIG